MAHIAPISPKIDALKFDYSAFEKGPATMTLGIFHSCTFVIHFQLYVRPLSSNHIRRRACEDPSYPDPEGDGSAIGYNVAPSQKILAIRFNPQTRARSLDALHGD
jgi:hypothetical protein